MKRLLFSLICLCAAHLTAAAHVLDQYLQVTQIALAPEGVRVVLRLIPGVEVADRVFALIDVDGDGQLSTQEEQAYAQRVLRDLSLRLNEQPLSLTLADAQFATRASLREGLGTMRMTFTAASALSGAGQQRLNFQNNHLPAFSAYLVNALVPESHALTISGQERDAQQRSVQINFQSQAVAANAKWRWLGLALFASLGAVLWLGWRRFNLKQTVLLAQRLMILFLLTLSAPQVFAHPEPVTLALLDVAPNQVTMNLHVPLDELAFVLGNEVAIHSETNWPETNLPQWQPRFQDYLLNHLRLDTQGQGWAVAVREMHIESSQQTPRGQSGMMQEVVVQLALTPPAGVTTRRFTLRYDAIMHQVVTHKALVSIRNDWAGGQHAEQPIAVGVIQVDTGTSNIAPLEINLQRGGWWSGFNGMVSLGMQHIKAGSDHLLFLLALLLPATLLVDGRRWGACGIQSNPAGRFLFGREWRRQQHLRRRLLSSGVFEYAEHDRHVDAAIRRKSLRGEHRFQPRPCRSDHATLSCFGTAHVYDQRHHLHTAGARARCHGGAAGFAECNATRHGQTYANLQRCNDESG